MPGPILLFGHGAPWLHPWLAGLAVQDVTRLCHAKPADSRIAALLEPFLDPFVRSFLFGLEQRAFDAAHAILVWRQGAGALHAFRYASEFRRLNLLPKGPPLHLWNQVTADGPAAGSFRGIQAERLQNVLDGAQRVTGPDPASALDTLEGWQAHAAISGADAFRRRLAARRSGTSPDLSPAAPTTGTRLALAGAPLGGDGLHRWLDKQGALVLDLQSPDAPDADTGALLRERRVETMVWQVDPHDDLHGWRKPGLQRLCTALGIRFVDLGFIPAWPETKDLPEALI
jgi:hypothetical protein